MGQQLFALCRARRILLRGEHDVLADGICPRAQSSSRISCSCIRMHTYLTEVVAEACLHEGTSRRVEGLTGRAQPFVDVGRYCGPSQVTWPDAHSLQASLFLA